MRTAITGCSAWAALWRALIRSDGVIELFMGGDRSIPWPGDGARFRVLARPGERDTVGVQLDDASFVGPGGELVAVGELEFAEHGGDVALDGFDGQV